MPDVPPPPPPYAVPSPESVSTADVPRQLAAAEAAWRPLRRAVRYATADAWTLAVCAALSVPCMIGGAAGIVLAVALAGIAYVEFKSVRQLKRLDPTALRRLAINQLALAAAAVLYALWNLYLTATDRGLLVWIKSQQLGADVDRETMAQVVETLRTILYVLYGSLAVIGGFVPAMTAWFYTSKQGRLQAYVAETPPWIIQMQRDRGQL